MNTLSVTNQRDLVKTTLEGMGKNPTEDDGIFSFNTGNPACPFRVKVSVNENNMIISCRLAMMGQVNLPAEEKMVFYQACLNLNTLTLPYAIAIYTNDDGHGADEDEWPIFKEALSTEKAVIA
jgi:hypothetical protein